MLGKSEQRLGTFCFNLCDEASAVTIRHHPPPCVPPLTHTGLPQQPMVVPFSVHDDTALAFDSAVTSVTSWGLNVTFTFKTNKPALVYYQLVVNVTQVMAIVVR